MTQEELKDRFAELLRQHPIADEIEQHFTRPYKAGQSILLMNPQQITGWQRSSSILPFAPWLINGSRTVSITGRRPKT